MRPVGRPTLNTSAASTLSMAGGIDGAWSVSMPKHIQVPDTLCQPFWEAVNQKGLLVQHCNVCDRLQYPPQPVCQGCASAAHLGWKEVKGRGHIATYIVIEDGWLNRRMPDQPYNL